MLRLKHDDPPDGIPPGLGALARYGAHQVYINIGKSGHSGSLKTHQEILKSMDPSKELQFLIGSGLKPQAQTVDPCLAVDGKL